MMYSALREQLLAQVQNHHLSPHRPEHQLSNTASPHHHNIDPAIAGSGIMNPSAGDSGGDDNGSDGRKSGKRELSTSKRAAQNRAAQVCGFSPSGRLCDHGESCSFGVEDFSPSAG